MINQELAAWNRSLVDKQIGLLCQQQRMIEDVVAALNDFRHRNPGDPTWSRHPLALDSNTETNLLTQPEAFWNRRLVTEQVAILTQQKKMTEWVIERLNDFLALNPGWPTLGRDPKIGEVAADVPGEAIAL